VATPAAEYLPVPQSLHAVVAVLPAAECLPGPQSMQALPVAEY
jgi:hypothetical protein